MKKPEKYFCDFCGKEVDNKSHRYIPAISYVDDNDGYPCGKHMETVSVDVCEECLLKCTNVEVGFRGTNLRFIHDAQEGAEHVR